MSQRNPYQCGLCSKDYKISQRVSNKAKDQGLYARILPACGHVFCENCVEHKLLFPVDEDEPEQSKSFSLTCPWPDCQKQSVLPSKSAKNLLLSSYHMSQVLSDSITRQRNSNHLLELFNSDTLIPKTIPKAKSTEKCFECQQSASLSCMQCSKFFCQQCFGSMHQFRALASHTAQPIGAPDANQLGIPDFCSQSCAEHEKLHEYYCVDCDVAVCGHCVVKGDHKSHNLMDLQPKNEELESEVNETVEKIKTALSFTQFSTKRINEECRKQKSSPTSALNELHHVFAHLHARLQLAEENIICQAREHCGDSRSALTKLHHSVEESQTKLEQLLSGCEDLLKSPISIAHCDYNYCVKTATELLQEIPCYLDVDNDQTESSLDLTVNEDLLSMIDAPIIVNSTADKDVKSRYSLASLNEVPEGVKAPPLMRSTSQSSEGSVHSVNMISITNTNPIQVIPPVAPVQPPQHQYNPPYSPASSSSSYSQRSLGPYGTPGYGDQRPSNPQPSGGRGMWLDTSPTEFLPGMLQAVNRDYFPNDRYSAPQYPTAPYPAAQYAGGYQPERSPTGSQGSDTLRFRDVRIKDPRYNQDPNFTIVTERGPLQPGPAPVHSMGRGFAEASGGRGASRGRGRGKPAPVITASPHYHSQKDNKPLYMVDAYPIVENTADVEICYVKSPAEIWVQCCNKRAEFNKLHHRLQAHGDKQRPLTSLVKVRYILARSDSGAWARAEVRGSNDKQVTVFFVDIGYTRTLTTANIRNTSGPLCSLPKQAIRCHLQGIVAPDGSDDWDSKVADEILQLQGRSTRVILKNLRVGPPMISDPQVDTLPCELLLQDEHPTPLALREILVFFELAVWHNAQYPAPFSNPKLDYLTPTPLRVSEPCTMYITHTESPYQIYAQKLSTEILQDSTGNYQLGEPLSEFTNLTELQQAMNSRYENPNSLKSHSVKAPRPGMSVAAEFYGEWFRAVVKLVLPAKLKVYFMDYGNESTLSPDKIRQIPVEYMKLPAQAHCLSLHDVQPVDGDNFSKAVNGAVNEMCRDKYCHAVTVEKGPDKQPFVRLIMHDTGHNLGDKLITYGLAKRPTNNARLDSILNEPATFTPNVPPVEDQTHFFLTAVTPSEIYVRSAEQQRSLDGIQDEMTSMYKSFDQTAGPPQIAKGEMCLISFNGEIQRAVLLEDAPPDDSTRVQAQVIDGGITVKPMLSKLRPLQSTSKISSFPPLCSIASIDRIKPSGDSKNWSSTACEVLQDLMDGCTECVVIPEDAKRVQENQPDSVKKIYEIIPCDITKQDEAPSNIQGAPGTMFKVSIRQQLLDKGVALRVKDTDLAPKVDASPVKTRYINRASLSKGVSSSGSGGRLRVSCSPGGSISATRPDEDPQMSDLSDTEKLLRLAAKKAAVYADAQRTEALQTPSPVRNWAQTPDSGETVEEKFD